MIKHISPENNQETTYTGIFLGKIPERKKNYRGKWGSFPRKNYS